MVNGPYPPQGIHYPSSWDWTWFLFKHWAIINITKQNTSPRIFLKGIGCLLLIIVGRTLFFAHGENIQRLRTKQSQWLLSRAARTMVRNVVFRDHLFYNTVLILLGNLGFLSVLTLVQVLLWWGLFHTRCKLDDNLIIICKVSLLRVLNIYPVVSPTLRLKWSWGKHFVTSKYAFTGKLFFFFSFSKYFTWLSFGE